MTEIELRPCPLCGCPETKIHIDRYAHSYIACDACPMRVQFYESGCTDAPSTNILSMLIMSWNRRAKE